jgi:phage terminase large subunit
MEITLTPTLKQHSAYQALEDDIHKFVVFGGGAGGGKTWLICEWLMIKAISYPNTRWFIGRNELTRLMQSTYITFTKVASHHNFKDWKLNGKYNYIEFGNGSRIDLLDVKKNPSDPLYERFGSTEYTGGALEEAGEIDYGAFDVLKARVGRHLNKDYNLKPKILITCNPKKNWLYTNVYKPYKEGNLDKDFAFIQALYKENPHTADSYEEQLSSITDKTMKERLMFGNWEYENDPRALMSFDAINDLFTNTVQPTRHERYLTAYIALFGNDRSVLAIWEDFTCTHIFTYTKTGTDVIAQEIKRILAEKQIPYSKCIVDEDGVGGGVLDHIRGAKGFMANRTPFPNRYTGKPDNFNNLKSQVTFTFADFVNTHKIAVQTDSEDIKTQIIEELEVIKSKDEVIEGKLQVESKEHIKELIGRSPDIADALVMRMYFELEGPTPEIAQQDPIAMMLARSKVRSQNAGMENRNTYL